MYSVGHGCFTLCVAFIIANTYGETNLQIKLNLFAQLFYWAMKQASITLFYGNSDFQSNKQISKEPEKNCWTHATHSVWAPETVFDDGKFPFQKHPKQSLSYRMLPGPNL